MSTRCSASRRWRGTLAMADPPNASISLCNASGLGMRVWLEPWAQEFILPDRGEVLLECWTDDLASDPIPEIEVTDDVLTVYGAAGSRIAVFIDGTDQDSFSAKHTAPDTGSLTTRGFVDVVFGNFPETRPGGLPTKQLNDIPRQGILTRLLRRVWPL